MKAGELSLPTNAISFWKWSDIYCDRDRAARRDRRQCSLKNSPKCRRTDCALLAIRQILVGP